MIDAIEMPSQYLKLICRCDSEIDLGFALPPSVEQ
jgi:hypothetical protein